MPVINGTVSNVPINQDASTSPNGRLLIDIGSGGTAGQQYADPTATATPTGTVAMGKTSGTNVIHAISLDSGGNVNVNVAAGSSGNAAAASTGGVVPVSADFAGLNVAGTLRGQTGVNPSGSIFAAQADIASVAGTTVTTGAGTTTAGTLRVVLATDQVPLTTGLPITAATLPLPTGASTAAKQPALGISGTPSSDVLTIQGAASMTAVAVAAASLPLPTGAATLAKQPALGTAGAASTDVISVQGIASMTPLAVSATSLPLPTGASTAAKQPALGTAGAASADVLTIQGAASMTAVAVSAAALPLPTGAALDTSVNGLLLSQGSTTSGQKGVLLQGAVSAAAPALTTAQTSPVSLDLGGNVRVISAAVADSTASGTLTVAQPTLNTAVVGGTLAAIGLMGFGESTVHVELSCAIGQEFGTLTTVVFDGTVDGTTWTPLLARRDDTGALVPSFTGTNNSAAAATNGIGFTVATAGLAGFRVRAATWGQSDGTHNDIVTVAMHISSGVGLLGGVHTNANRAAAIVHRTTVAAVDTLAKPAALTLTSGSSCALAANTYFVGVSAGNAYGTTGPGPINSTLSTVNQAMRVTLAQVAGATYYDIFMTTAAAPLWVGRITESQRATGGFGITALGVTGAVTGPAAGQFDIQVIGTGLATNVNPYLVNTAVSTSGITAINCAGYAVAHVKVLLAVTDLRSLPALTLIPMLLNASDASYDLCQPFPVPLFTGLGQGLRQDFAIQLDGSTGLLLAVAALAGQGATVTIVVELA